jgi:hypothetical protein
MWLWYNWAIPGPVIVVLHGKKIAVHKHPWSTIMSIASLPFIGGSPVIRSIATLWNGHTFVSVGM